jgi:tRNA dimethylallyltransferase
MLERGMVEEVAGLRVRPDLDLERPAMRAVGYRQVWQYLDGSLGHEDMVQRGVIATRQLAKRQLTWLRSEPGIFWLRGEGTEVHALVRGFLHQYGI